VDRELRLLVEQFGLGPNAEAQLEVLLDGVADPAAPTSVHAREEAIDVHLADSLVALEIHAVRGAGVLADIGTGAGFPGLPLAIALPEARVLLVESGGRAAAFAGDLAARAGLGNVEVVAERVEDWRAGIGAVDVVTARALAGLPVVLEYAAPLLGEGGNAIVWRGRRSPEEEKRAALAADELGLALEEVRSVRPFPRAARRHLHRYVKVRPTPDRFPRRAGMARKRPLGSRPGPSLPC
jgi:16S rRNA (guanine527-N7)-methyltransferase